MGSAFDINREIIEPLDQREESWNEEDDAILDDIFCAIMDTCEIAAGHANAETISLSSPMSDSESGGTTNRADQSRIRTYTARKQEMEELLKELPQLENYLDMLKHRAIDASKQTSSMQKRLVVNACLREKMHQQQFLFARVQAAMTQYMSKQEKAIPIDTFIHLAKNREQRIQTRSALKEQILRDAKRFVKERSVYLDLGIPYEDQTSFITANGDYCALAFGIMPLKRVVGAKKVFDALKHHLANIEVLISEGKGDLIVREQVDTDSLRDVEGIFQSRFLRSLANNLHIESNQMMFSNFEAKDAEYGEGRACGVIVIASVNQDDLYPYSPKERVRHDVTAVWTVKTYARTVMNGKNKEEVRVEVVVTRASFHKLHRTPMSVDRDTMMVMRDRLTQDGDLLMHAIKGITKP